MFLMYLCFPGGSDGKASACNAGDPGSIPGSEDTLEKEMAIHLPGKSQYMGLQRVRHD